MQEYQVTVGGTRHRLIEPFFVLATQNPIEQEGTYPLPEAQLDRFMFNIRVDYPNEEEEFQIVKRTTADVQPSITPTLNADEIANLARIVRRVPVADHVTRYALQFTRLTRKEKGDVPEFIRKYVSWGAGPRASQYLVLAAKARAVLHGRYFANCDDIRAVAPPVLRHRILTNFNAEAEGIKPDDLVARLIATIPFDDYDESAGGKLPQVFRSADAG
jgi:MoxR-like ATPase